MPDLDDDGDPGGRLAAGRVQNVARDRAHGAILSRRILVIFICSAAASLSSASGSLASRSREQCEHLLGRLAGCADDEDEAEPFFVLAVAGGKIVEHIVGGPVDSRLFAARPGGGRGEPGSQDVEVADPGMGRERLEPVGLGEPPPDSLGGFEQRRLGSKRPGRVPSARTSASIRSSARNDSRASCLGPTVDHAPDS